MQIATYAIFIVACALAFLSVLSVVLSIQGCAPRSATKCLNEKTNEWVKCPPNMPAGTILKQTKAKR